MIHDEKTTEIELPPKPVSNIVHVNFATSEPRKPTANAGAQGPNRVSSVSQFIPDRRIVSTPEPSAPELSLFESSLPWVLRILAVLTILGLSLLIV